MLNNNFSKINIETTVFNKKQKVMIWLQTFSEKKTI